MPTFWRVLVKPLEPVTKTKSGLIVTSTEDAQKYAMYLAEVLALGPFAGTSERLGGGGKAFQRAAGFPAVGSFVIFGKYAGQKMRYKDTELAIINDDELRAIFYSF
ncbi:MAG: co-chaperone GroES [Chlamydiae bacterium]|nr:co-chaperone GroES [Chlamydiota bacterium]